MPWVHYIIAMLQVPGGSSEPDWFVNAIVIDQFVNPPTTQVFTSCCITVLCLCLCCVYPTLCHVLGLLMLHRPRGVCGGGSDPDSWTILSTIRLNWGGVRLRVPAMYAHAHLCTSAYLGTVIADAMPILKAIGAAERKEAGTKLIDLYALPGGRMATSF